MSRSKWKGPFISINNLKYLESTKNHLRTVGRNVDIVPSFIGLTFNVYNGKTFSELVVLAAMVGHKFGEFSFTRAQYIFKKKKTKKKKLKKK